MPHRHLTALVIALTLTLLLPLAFALGWPAALCWTLIAAHAAAWSRIHLRE